MFLIHTGLPLTPADVWTAWSLEPGVVLPIIGAALLYAQGVWILWRRAGRGRGVSQAQAASFAAGIAVLIIAQVSPIAAMGGVLFSAHMTQHVLIMSVAAPLLVFGAPMVAFAWGTSPRIVRWTRDRVLHRRAVRGIGAVLALPLVAWLLHGAAIWVWHVPQLYAASVQNDMVHAAQHASFFGTALLFWWAVHRRAAHGIAVLYLFTTAVHSSLLGALLAFEGQPLYAPYLETTAAWGLSPLQDQQLGGFIMWVPGGTIYVLAALALLGSFIRSAQRRAPTWALPLVLLVLAAGCAADAPAPWRRATLSTEARHGRELLQQYGCGACHEIAGVRAADGRVGPPLTGVSQRVYIAGYLPNEPRTMAAFIMQPSRFRQPTGMPDLGVTHAEARAMVEYLRRME